MCVPLFMCVYVSCNSLTLAHAVTPGCLVCQIRCQTSFETANFWYHLVATENIRSAVSFLYFMNMNLWYKENLLCTDYPPPLLLFLTLKDKCYNIRPLVGSSYALNLERILQSNHTHMHKWSLFTCWIKMTIIKQVCPLSRSYIAVGLKISYCSCVLAEM